MGSIGKSEFHHFLLLKLPCSYSFPMVFLWFSYGFPRVFLLVFLWFSMVCYGFLGRSYGFPIVVLWFSYWFSYCFIPNLHIAKGTIHTAALIQDLLGSTARTTRGGAWPAMASVASCETWHSKKSDRFECFLKPTLW